MLKKVFRGTGQVNQATQHPPNAHRPLETTPYDLVVDEP
jgi:hypothetical protein